MVRTCLLVGLRGVRSTLNEGFRGQRFAPLPFLVFFRLRPKASFAKSHQWATCQHSWLKGCLGGWLNLDPKPETLITKPSTLKL